jgi:putative SOS response-associated peptidase YedK
MCGRYGFSVKNAVDIYNRFDTYNQLLDYQPHWNIAPGTLNPVVTRHSPNTIERMLWGLIPHWARDDSFKFKTINARVEGIEDKPVYRKPFRYQRCLIPATGFYEWDKSVKPSIPYYFHLPDEQIFAFAGLFDVWTDPKMGKDIHSYTIITTRANDLVGRIHQRMPVILHRTDEDTWLNPDISEAERLLPLLRPYPDAEMEAYAVASTVNNPRIDTQELIRPLPGH